MRKILAFILLLTLSASVFGCRASEYSDSVRCYELMDSAVEQIPVNQGYNDHDSEHVEYFFGEGDLFDDHSVRYSSLSSDINEVGIFHAKDKSSAAELLAKIREYLKHELDDNRAFVESYSPSELSKLEGAEVRRYGNYVVFAVLDRDAKEKFFKTVEILLTEGK